MSAELAELEAAWREAEEIAGIADALPDEALEPSEHPRIHLPDSAGPGGSADRHIGGAAPG